MITGDCFKELYGGCNNNRGLPQCSQLAHLDCFKIGLVMVFRDHFVRVLSRQDKRLPVNIN